MRREGKLCILKRSWYYYDPIYISRSSEVERERERERERDRERERETEREVRYFCIIFFEVM